MNLGRTPLRTAYAGRLAMGALLVLTMLSGCVSSDPVDATPQVGQDEDGEGKPLAAAFSWSPEIPVAGDAVSFEPSVSGGVPPYAYLWTFSDTDTSQIARPMRVFDAAGDHVVSLEVTDTNGATVMDDASIFVVASGSESSGGGSGSSGGSGGGSGGSGGEEVPPLAPPPSTADPRERIQDETVRGLYDEIQASLISGDAVTVPAIEIAGLLGFDTWGSPKSFDVILQESDMLHDQTFFEVNGQPVQAPFVEVYEGHVEGEEDDLVRLVLSPWWARGSVRDGDTSYAIRINFDGNSPNGAGSRSMAPASEGESFSPEPSGCQSGLAAWAPLYATPVVAVGRSTETPLIARVILDGDGPLIDALGADAWATLIAQLMEVDSIYDYEVSIRLQVAGVHLHTGNVYPDPEVSDPFDHMQAYWKDHHAEDRDIVHLVTGWDSSYAKANCIGGAGTPGGYTFTPYPWELAYEVFHINAYAHELGHIFDAHHHYGNHGEAELATIMIQGYTPGYDPNFSSVSKAAMRGWAEQYLS